MKTAIYYGVKGRQGVDGIYRMVFDERLKKLTRAVKEADISAVYMACSQNKEKFYAIGNERQGHCEIHSFQILRDGSLEKIGETIYSFSGISHMTLSRDEKYLFIAVYGESKISVVEIENGAAGKVAAEKIFPGCGVRRDRQECSHPHFIYENEKGTLFVTDLGTDQIHILSMTVGEKGSPVLELMKDVYVASGCGPRHLSVGTDSRWLYLISELSSEIRYYEWQEETRQLVEKQCLSLLISGDQRENLAADICMGYANRRIYTSNRGQDNVDVFEMEEENGRITQIMRIRTRGWTRNIRVSKGERYLILLNEEFQRAKGAIEIIFLGKTENSIYRLARGAACMEVLCMGE